MIPQDFGPVMDAIKRLVREDNSLIKYYLDRRVHIATMDRVWEFYPDFDQHSEEKLSYDILGMYHDRVIFINVTLIQDLMEDVVAVLVHELTHVKHDLDGYDLDFTSDECHALIEQAKYQGANPQKLTRSLYNKVYRLLEKFNEK
jgi:hypothetical protein